MFGILSTIIETALGFGNDYYYKTQDEIEFDKAYDEFYEVTAEIKRKDYKDCKLLIQRQQELLEIMENINKK